MTLQARQECMIKQQLETCSIRQNTLLALLRELAREDFVPSAYRDFSYSDMAIPLAHQQVMMTPLEEASLLQSVNVQANESVLEIGTGSAYLTALLAHQAQHVYTVDYFADFTRHAQQRLADYSNISYFTGDGSRGWAAEAPYDVIILTGALADLPESIRLQILPGGRIFTLLGCAPIVQASVHTLMHDGLWRTQHIFQTSIPPLIDPRADATFTL